jgi:hypothetical protein
MCIYRKECQYANNVLKNYFDFCENDFDACAIFKTREIIQDPNYQINLTPYQNDIIHLVIKHYRENHIL